MWEGPLGTVAVVGIATKEASLQVTWIIISRYHLKTPIHIDRPMDT